MIMGRSVYVPGRASSTAYIHGLTDNVYFDENDWDELLDDIRNVIEAKYPSFCRDSSIFADEGTSILENEHGRVIVSEYCGVTAVSLVPETDSDQQHPELAEAWCRQIEDSFHALLVRSYPDRVIAPVAIASNGETLYRKV